MFMPLAKLNVVGAALFVLASTAAQAQVVGGNAVIDRAATDSFSNFTVVDRNNDIDINTVLTSWSVWVGNAGTIGLAIFRPIAGNPLNLSLVNSTALETAVMGLNTFALPGSFAVQAGDFVGLHIGTAKADYAPGAGSGPQVMSYSNNNSGLTTSLAGHQNRIYSVSVSAVPEPSAYAMAALAALGLVGLAKRKRT